MWYAFCYSEVSLVPRPSDQMKPVEKRNKLAIEVPAPVLESKKTTPQGK